MELKKHVSALLGQLKVYLTVALDTETERGSHLLRMWLRSAELPDVLILTQEEGRTAPFLSHQTAQNVSETANTH